jgi:NAD(P)-dependent dehydrogenase (short-subunit alcohol dehydrogenase family)
MTTPETNFNARAVLVTGTSSGIGRACALLLTKNGFTVLAGVRKPTDGEALAQEAGERVIPLQIDVTDHDGVTAAARLTAGMLRERGLSLYALVNNAGIGTSAPLEFQPLDDIR